MLLFNSDDGGDDGGDDDEWSEHVNRLGEVQCVGRA